jgi:hypothetical protein
LARTRIAAAGTVDIQWLEEGLWEVLRVIGCRLLGRILTESSRRDIPPDNRFADEHRHERKRTLHTVLGKVEFSRDYYWNPEGSRTPFDQETGILGESCSPGLRRLMGYAASKSSYGEASEDLRVLSGLNLAATDIQREVLATGPHLREALERRREVPAPREEVPILYIAVDGTGAPMRPEALAGRKGKQADGSARTREVKMGCVFTQTHRDEKGDPIRDPGSTTYVANFKEAADFGADLLAEARYRGLGKARQRVILGDGALWIWELARTLFPGAQQILDYYHASEHLHALADALGVETEAREAWKEHLWEGRIEELLGEASKIQTPIDRDRAEGEVAYFQKNAERMRYADFRKRGLFIGSGVVEAGCKHVVGKRMKQSGMFWSLPGAENILEYRCAVLNGRYDDFWRARFGCAA